MSRTSPVNSLAFATAGLLLAGALASCAPARPGGAEPSSPQITIRPAETVPVPSEFRLPGAPPVHAVLPIQTPPRIDGRLDEEVWKSAPRMGRMHLDTGLGPMKFDTIARLVRDEQYLYFGVECLHPQIGEVPVRPGVRDKVSWAGETVELFVDTDRAADGYVQVIFDMSGAFTDMYNGDTRWNGDVVAATEVGDAGWRLEARLKIADLGGDGKVDPFVWSGNVARNTRGQSGSWARILGNYQQPTLFGLLPFAGKELAVEDVGLGVFAPPGESSQRVPVRLAVRNLTGQGAEYRLRLAALPPGPQGTVDKTLRLGPSQRQEALVVLPVGSAEKVHLAIAPADKGTPAVFQAELPVHRLPVTGDCLVTEQLTCAIRAATPIVLEKGEGAMYLMAQSLTDKPTQWSGNVTIRTAEEARGVWRRPVRIELPPRAGAARLVKLPTDELKAGKYEIVWVPDEPARTPPVKTHLDYLPDLRQRLKELLSPPAARDVLRRLGCPTPKSPRDEALVQVKIDRLADYLRQEAGNVEIDLTRSILNNYRQLTEVVDKLKTTGRHAADLRGWFETAFYSPVDGSAQPYSLFVPYDYDKDPRRRYALVVELHGAGGTHGGEAGFLSGQDRHVTDRLVLRTLARGKFCGYWGVPGNDVMNEIQQVKDHYRIDADAVHLAGGSMGGFGSFEIGATFADVFATCKPLCGGGFWLPVEQMRNLPTFVHHGLADTVVRAWQSIFTAAKMEHYRCPVQLYLHPGIGHDVGTAANAITTWETLKSTRRDPHPQTVVLAGGRPALKKAYWLAVLRYADPHEDAYLRGSFVGRNHLNLMARNVSWAKVSLPGKWVDPAAPLQITLGTGRKWTDITPGQAKAVYLRLDGEKLQATTELPKQVEDPTSYLGGGSDRLFTEGRALRIVYGTQGSPGKTAALAKLAEGLRRWPNDYEVGGYPVLKDTEADQQTLSNCDLVLLGTASENALVARMAKDLPVKLVDGKVVVETRPKMEWDESAVAFRLFYRNPLAPARRIWWLAGVDEREAFDKLVDSPAGSDLTVQSRDKHAVLAAARVVDDWQLARIGPLEPAKGLWPAPAALEAECARALTESLPVDVSLVEVSKALRQPEQLTWSELTVGEALCLIHGRDLMIVPVTGKDLLAWRESVTEKGKQFDRPWAGLAAEALKPEATYQVLIDTEVASSLEPANVSFRACRFVPESEFEAIKQRFVRGHVKP